MKLSEINDSVWEVMVKPNLEEDVLNDPKLKKIAMVLAKTIITSDQNNPFKTLMRLGKGYYKPSLNMAAQLAARYGVGPLAAGNDSPDAEKDFQYVFDCVLAAANGGVEFEDWVADMPPQEEMDNPRSNWHDMLDKRKI